MLSIKGGIEGTSLSQGQGIVNQKLFTTKKFRREKFLGIPFFKIV